MGENLLLKKIEPDATRLILRISVLRQAIVQHRKAMAEYKPAEYDSALWAALDADDTLAYEGMKR